MAPPIPHGGPESQFHQIIIAELARSALLSYTLFRTINTTSRYSLCSPDARRVHTCHEVFLRPGFHVLMPSPFRHVHRVDQHQDVQYVRLEHREVSRVTCK